MRLRTSCMGDIRRPPDARRTRKGKDKPAPGEEFPLFVPQNRPEHISRAAQRMGHGRERNRRRIPALKKPRTGHPIFLAAYVRATRPRTRVERQCLMFWDGLLEFGCHGKLDYDESD